MLLGSLLTRHAQLGRSLPQSELKAKPSVCLARQILEDDPAREWTLQSLGEAVGLAPLRLLRAFRSALGLTPHDFQTQLRVNWAKRKLRFEGSMTGSITDVALEVGFCDQSHLNRHFKRLVGVTLGQYRLS